MPLTPPHDRRFRPDQLSSRLDTVITGAPPAERGSTDTRTGTTLGNSLIHCTARSMSISAVIGTAAASGPMTIFASV